MLVVLDNAVNAQQVRPLLPGSSGCLVLVTSRSQLAGLVIHDGAHRMMVDMLQPHEAVALLGAILGSDRIEAEPAAAADLAAACIYLPLALCIAAELADTRPRATLAELAAELSGAQSKLDALHTADHDESTAVRAVLSWSYTSLTATVARAFRLLGLHPGPDFSVDAAAALLGTSLEATRRHLGALTGAHLLARPAQRYRFHDLLREYAEELARTESQAECEEAARRTLTWYLTTAQTAGRLLYQDRDGEAGRRPIDGQDAQFLASRVQALAWCQAEHANLLAATRLAASIGDDVTAWRLPAAMREYFQLQQPFADWLAMTEVGLVATRRLGDRLAQAMMHSSLGGAHNYQHRPQECLEHNLQALAIHRRLGPVVKGAESEISTGMVLVNVGGAFGELRRHEESIGFLTEARAMAQRTGERDVEGHALESLAAQYWRLERFDDAVVCLHDALAIFGEIKRPFGEAVAHARLAYIYSALERYERAVEHAEHAAEISHRIGSTRNEAFDLVLQAKALGKLNRPNAAIECWRRALAIAEEPGHPFTDDDLEYIRNASPAALPDPL